MRSLLLYYTTHPAPPPQRRLNCVPYVCCSGIPGPKGVHKWWIATVYDSYLKPYGIVRNRSVVVGVLVMNSGDE